MATKLKNMQLTSVDLVRAGANQEADICLYKSAAPVEAAEGPVETEQNIFKRFLQWLRADHTEAPSEPENPIEKADDQPDLAGIYKNAITESLQSIMADDNLTLEEKNAMVEKSIAQYHDAMADLLKSEDAEDSDSDEGPVEKFNQNHDAIGRFATSGGGGGGAAGLPAISRQDVLHLNSYGIQSYGKGNGMDATQRGAMNLFRNMVPGKTAAAAVNVYETKDHYHIAPGRRGAGKKILDMGGVLIGQYDASGRYMKVENAQKSDRFDEIEEIDP